MCHFSYDVMCFCIDMNYVMWLIFYLSKTKKKSKKNFLLYFAIHRRNEGVVTAQLGIKVKLEWIQNIAN
jgi:hypothetical protein